MQICIKFIFNRDTKRADIEVWLSEQADVMAITGDNITYRLKKRIDVQATPDKPAYSLYTFILAGSSGDAAVIVIAENNGAVFQLKTLRKI